MTDLRHRPDSGPLWQSVNITGSGAESFLERMLSNRIDNLDEDSWRGAFLLEPTGRIVSGGRFMRTDKGFVAVCDDGWAEPLVDGLAKYRIADAVEFEIDELMGVLAQGDEDPAPPAVIRYRDGFDLRINYGGAADTIRFTRAPEQVLTAADAERQRMRAGIPAFGSELTERTIPLEAGMMDWLSNTKGCYVGQEVIERMWSRDRVARRLASFVSDGEQQLTTPLQFDSDGIKATITSTFVDRGRTVALGYVNTDKPVEVQDSGITWQVSPLGPE